MATRQRICVITPHLTKSSSTPWRRRLKTPSRRRRDRQAETPNADLMGAVVCSVSGVLKCPGQDSGRTVSEFSRRVNDTRVSSINGSAAPGQPRRRRTYTPQTHYKLARSESPRYSSFAFQYYRRLLGGDIT